ncbi:class 1a ribonucleoside-diphosphate reductase subunit alpha [Buchnera aphidicola (Kurisakia onigurumii)]|uniref:class 1a ribonucleoside-diphosphate reductase subunit alpha n=1 Tax=Buchnera aphidicola TaxID=9 RepID=UPI0031B67384
MKPILLVTKRDGKKENFKLEKIKKILIKASKGLKNISISQVFLRSKMQFYNEITTIHIHKTIIKSSADLISEKCSEYQYFSARLAIFYLRKEAFGKFTPPTLYDHVKKLVKIKKYDSNLLNFYSKQEFNQMNSFIDHMRDMNFSYSAVKQLENKYLLQNKITGKIYESAQFLYILISACLFSQYPSTTRMIYVKKFYHAISQFKISLPTPIMSGLRTPTKQFSSCVLIECADTLHSINATASSIVKYVSQRAGIGINVGQIRAIGSSIRNGEAFHTGCIPFYKYFQSAVKSCSQGGVRGGAATFFYPIWHLEVESLLVLKNNRGIEENRVRNVDYGVQINKFIYRRMILGKKITLFSPNDVQDLYQSFFSDQKRFEYLYLKYEKNSKIRKKKINSIDLFSLMMQERTSTGRIYIQHVDHCNSHSPFDCNIAPIKQSNLCLEILLPTKPLDSTNEKIGEIALCTLSALNLGAIKNIQEIPEITNLIVRALDAVLDYQKYPVAAAKKGALQRRSLGIGVINFAYYLAKNNVRYSDGSANNITHKTFEYIQYYLLKSSCKLSQEKGSCPLFHETNYYKGILPIDTYKKSVDEICTEPLHLDWEYLRKKIKKYGLRNSTLSALMPSETSSQISNATNGIEPPRGFISIKASKDGMLKQVVPEYEKLKNNYELLWDLPNNTGYLQLAAIMQKFIDQSISVNTNYDPQKFPNNRIPMQQLIQDLLTAYKLGIKTLYYQNTRDGAGEFQKELYKQDNQYQNKNYNSCDGDSCNI